jgi:hypothetical protein
LNQSVEEEPIETSVSELDAILVVLVKAFMTYSRVVRYQEHTAANASAHDAHLGRRWDIKAKPLAG